MFQVLGLAYGIQMSNDGQHFSEPLIMVAFDPRCANCSNVGYSDVTCEENVSVGFIVCYLLMLGDSLMQGLEHWTFREKGQRLDI